MREDQVQPITPQERVHCAYCAKPLQPAHACRKTFYSGTVEADGRSPEQQLSGYQSNRRVVRVRRSYHQPIDYSSGRKSGPRVTSTIEVVHFPESPDEWGFWGLFCGQLCAARFGYNAHRAGYRIKARAEA